MIPAWTIAKREIKSLFVSPIIYIVVGIFAVISGAHFILSLENFDALLQEAQIRAQLNRNPEILQQINLNGMLISNVVGFMFYLLLFLSPMLTMRLLSEERNQGTYELLLTSPIGNWDIVLGKYIASLFLYIVILATHALFLLVMFSYGNPEPLPVFAGYLGLFVSGAVFMAIGLFTSSLFKLQIISAMAAAIINLILMMIGWASQRAPGNLGKFLESSSLITQFDNFNKGLISISGIVYFLTLAIFFVAATQVSVQSLKRS